MELAGEPEDEAWSPAKQYARLSLQDVNTQKNSSSVPHLVANKLPPRWADMFVPLRRDHRMTTAEIAGRLQLPRRIVAGYLARFGLGRLAAGAEPAGAALQPRTRRQTHAL